MTNKQQRDVMRAIHLAVGSILGIIVYAPADLALSIRPYVQFAVFPLLGLSGLWLWQGQKLARRFSKSQEVS